MPRSESGAPNQREGLKSRVEQISNHSEAHVFVENFKSLLAEKINHVEQEVKEMSEIIERLSKDEIELADLKSDFLQRIDYIYNKLEQLQAEEEAATGGTSERKGWFGKMKEKLTKAKERVSHSFREGTIKGQIANTGYKTATSVLGVKFITDLGLAAAKQGDLYNWYVGKGKTKKEKKGIAEVMEAMFQKAESAPAEGEQTESADPVADKAAALEAKIEALDLPDSEKTALKKRLDRIVDHYERETEKDKFDHKKQVAETLGLYIRNKISGMQIAKDAFNTVLTGTGLFALRGAAYATTASLERIIKERVRLKKETAVGEKAKGVFKKSIKDALFNSTKETLRSFGAVVGLGKDKEKTGKEKVVNLIKSVGTIMRGFGIYGVALGDIDVGKAWDRVGDSIAEKGLPMAVVDNYGDNLERLGKLVGIGGEEGEDVETKKDTAVQPTEEPQAVEETKAETAETGEKKVVPVVPVALETPEAQLQENQYHNPDTGEVETDYGTEEVKKGEGVLHSVYRLEKDNPEMFEGMTKQEIHEWRVGQLKAMGFKFKDGAWLYPMTVHEGAEVQMYTDEDGEPQVRLINKGGDTVTVHKNYLVRMPNLNNEVAREIEGNQVEIHNLKLRLGFEPPEAGGEGLTGTEGSMEAMPTAQDMAEVEQAQQEFIKEQEEYMKELEQLSTASSGEARVVEAAVAEGVAAATESKDTISEYVWVNSQISVTEKLSFYEESPAVTYEKEMPAVEEKVPAPKVGETQVVTEAAGDTTIDASAKLKDLGGEDEPVESAEKVDLTDEGLKKEVNDFYNKWTGELQDIKTTVAGKVVVDGAISKLNGFVAEGSPKVDAVVRSILKDGQLSQDDYEKLATVWMLESGLTNEEMVAVLPLGENQDFVTLKEASHAIKIENNGVQYFVYNEQYQFKLDDNNNLMLRKIGNAEDGWTHVDYNITPAEEIQFVPIDVETMTVTDSSPILTESTKA